MCAVLTQKSLRYVSDFVERFPLFPARERQLGRLLSVARRLLVARCCGQGHLSRFFSTYLYRFPVGATRDTHGVEDSLCLPPRNHFLAFSFIVILPFQSERLPLDSQQAAGLSLTQLHPLRRIQHSKCRY